MNRFFTIFAAAAFLATGLDASAEITLKRARISERDTVTNRKYNLVLITDPGNIAAINGEQVKVYKTGAFGKQLTLSEGENNVEVSIFRGTEFETRVLKLFYIPDSGIVSRPETLSQPEDRLFYVETKENAYLQYGHGGDRLGGSKMGYIDKGIVLKVVGSIDDLYKVQLSDKRFAYIPQENVEPCSRSSRTVNTNNIGISNLDSRDRVRLSLPERLPYASSTSLDPTVINIDVFGAMNNSNWVSQYNEPGIIDYVDLQQIESDVLRLVIKLKEKYCWGYSVNYDGNSLTIDVRHSPKDLSMKGIKIGLDAGHGGELPGAVSPTGLKESEINLSIVKELEKILLRKGARVVLSRSDDTNVSMPERKRIFRNADIDLMISIHNNAGGSPFVPMGTSTYYKHITNRELASTLLKRLLELNVPCYGLTGNFNFSLNAPTEYPNALVEGLFMSSLPDEEFLSDPANHKLIAEKVAAGLEDYLRKVADAKDTGKKKNSKR